MDDFFARLALRLLGIVEVTPAMPPPFAPDPTTATEREPEPVR